MKINIQRDMAFRSSDDGGGNGRTLEGYAAVFNVDTEIRSWEGNFIERLAKGAFRKTIKENPNPLMQWDHGRDSRVGTTPIGKYESLKEDNEGLLVRGELFDNEVVEPVRQAIEAGAVTGMSFAFQVLRDEWRDNKGKLIKPDELRELLYESGDRGPLRRTIKEVRMSEAGPVGRPAYKETSVGVRSAEDLQEEERSEILRSYSQTMLVEDDGDTDDQELRSWLDAETEYNDSLRSWLEAEATFRWLQAEDEYNTLQESNSKDSAVPTEDRRHTLWLEENSPKKDAVREHTSELAGSTPNPNHQKEKAMTLAELRALLETSLKRRGEIAEEFRDSTLPEAEGKEWTELDSTISKARSDIASIEERAKIAKDGVAEGTRSTEETHRESPAFHRSTGDEIYSISEIRKASFSDNDFLARATDAAKKVVERSVTAIQTDEDKSKTRLEGLLNQDAEVGSLAARAIATGSPLYERAFAKAMRFGSLDILSLDERKSVDEARAIAIATGASGNLAVPIQLDPTLVHLDAAGGYITPVRQLAKTVTLTGKDYTTLSITKVDAYRAGEAAPAIDSSPTLASQLVNVTKVQAWVPFSMEADEDWAGMRSEIFQLIAEAKAREEAAQFLFGSGTGLNPQGLFTGTTNTVPVAGAAGAGTLTFADVVALTEALPVEYENNAVFIGSKPEFTRLRTIPGTAGGSAVYGDLEGPNSNRLLDSPVYRVAGTGLGTSKSASAGQKFLLYGDIRRAYTIIDRVGMNIELIPMNFAVTLGASPASQTYGAVPTGQRGFFAHWRNYGKVVDANAVRALVTK